MRLGGHVKYMDGGNLREARGRLDELEVGRERLGRRGRAGQDHHGERAELAIPGDSRVIGNQS